MRGPLQFVSLYITSVSHPSPPLSLILSLVNTELTKVRDNPLKWRPRSRLILSVSAYTGIPSVLRPVTEIAYFRLLLFAKFAIRLAQRINVFGCAVIPSLAGYAVIVAALPSVSHKGVKRKQRVRWRGGEGAANDVS